ncbi:MAG: peptidoglycan-binding domain-containing protein [Actinomycetota bacterium]
MTLPTPPTIKEGSRTQIVKNAQGLLLAHGFDPKGIDGIFGPNTTAATKAFQRSAGIADDGIIGPITWGKLLQ